MQTNTLASQAQAAINSHFSTLGSAHPFYSAKQQAKQTFEQLGFPGPKDEDYKYTPITNALAEVFDLSQPTAISNLTQAELAPWLHQEIDAYQLVLLNGQLSSTHSKPSSHKQPWQVLTLREAYQQHPTLFLAHFGQHTKDAFVTLNTTLFEDGLFLHIADHTILDKPLFIYHITDARLSQGITHPRLFIVAGQNSQATLVTSWHTLGQHPSFTNAVTEIVLEKHAQLDYYTLQTQLGQAYQVNASQCYQASQSLLNAYTFTWDGRLIRNNLDICINAPYSEANMYGLYCLSEQQHVDNHTAVDHQQPYTQSKELYKGIVAGEATGVFNGKIYVRTAAQKTNAFQANNNLVLADQATMHTKPQLEIWADDVKCSHGATTGQLDEAQLFYLRARGIPLETARYILLNAFASDVIDRVTLPALRHYLHKALEQKLTILGPAATSKLEERHEPNVAAK